MARSLLKSRAISFQTKVLLPVLAFLVIVPAITVWTLDRHIKTSGQEEALRTLTTVRAVFRNSLEIRERNLRERFRNMVKEPRLKAVAQLGDTLTMQAFLTDAQSEFGPEVRMILFSPVENDQHPSFVDWRQDSVPLNPEELIIPTIAEALLGQLNSTLVSLDGQAFNLISIPVRITKPGRPIGVLSIWIEFGGSAVQDLKSLTRTEVVLFQNQTILASTLDTSLLSVNDLDYFENTRQAREHIEPYLIDNEHFHVLAGSLSNQDGGNARLSYLLLSSYEEDFQALKATRKKLLGIGLAGIALSVTVISLIVRKLTRPLRELRAGAEAVGKGDLDKRVTVHSKDECGELASAFNQMTSGIKQSQKALQANVLELERTQSQLIQREALLKESEEGLRLIIEGARDHVIFTLNEQGRILRWNGAAERLLGYSTEEAKRTGYRAFFSAEDQSGAIPENLIKQAREEGRAEFEGWRIGKDEKRFWADVTLSRLESLPGETTGGYVEIARDISTRRKAEKALVKARNAAEASNRAKNEFMANMSHEIRTPMNGVIGMTSLLMEEDLTSEQKDLTETIKNSADSLLEIIDDILDISKIEAGQMEISNAPVNMVELLELTVSSFAHTCRNKGLDLHMVVYKEVPPLFESDASRIRQVLSNLIGNAVKFTECGGIRIDMNFCRKRKCIEFTVTDTGIGIPEDKFDQVFNPFFQVESHNSRRYGGTGLGLSISKKIAHLLGGEISFRSILGEGSTFTFSLRVNPEREETAFRIFPGASITLASNQVQTKAAMADQLENWECQVKHIELSKEALQNAFSHNSCDLLLIEQEEDHLAVNTYMAESGDCGVPFIRLAHPIGKPSPQWHGDGLTLAKPWKPLELNAHLSKILKNQAPVKLQVSSTQQRREEQLESSFATECPHSILIVEDNSINAKVLETILKRLGFKPGIAVNGEDCIRALEEKPYDIIFMDLQMPVMDGYQATARILNSDTMDHPVFITAFTANARQDDRDACTAVGMHDFVAKPARPHKIIEVLRRAHDWLEEQAKVGK